VSNWSGEDVQPTKQTERVISPPSLSATTARGRVPRRLSQLVFGLVLYGVSMGLLVQSRLGVMPWDVLHQGLARRLDVSLGLITAAVGVLVLLAWIPLRERPGIGTVANVIVIGLAVDATLAVLPAVDAMAARIGFAVAGIALNAIATAAYIGVRLGPGPRDGLMTALVRRTRFSVRLVRTSIEVVVVVIGVFLGGTLGVATVLYALTIGPLTQLVVPYLVIHLPSDERTASPALAAPGRWEE
jgi:uncharacterized membrane protein YczE